MVVESFEEFRADESALERLGMVSAPLIKFKKKRIFELLKKIQLMYDTTGKVKNTVRLKLSLPQK